jgi:ssDNA-binding Zn-finger/Zn-ribbon topoisomerase 1
LAKKKPKHILPDRRCSSCLSPLAVRTSGIGKLFIGCTSYPQCLGTEEITPERATVNPEPDRELFDEASEVIYDLAFDLIGDEDASVDCAGKAIMRFLTYIKMWRDAGDQHAFDVLDTTSAMVKRETYDSGD